MNRKSCYSSCSSSSSCWPPSSSSSFSARRLRPRPRPRPAWCGGAAPSCLCTIRVTSDTPCTLRTLKSMLACLCMPSLSETRMNWESGKCCRIMAPMLLVWLGSSAASTSSSRNSGPGLYLLMARSRASATSDFWPPESELRLSFHTRSTHTFISRPVLRKSFARWPSGTARRALAPGSIVPKILPKLSFTIFQHELSSSIRFWSYFLMSFSRSSFSRSTMPRFVFHSSIFALSASHLVYASLLTRGSSRS
mmetsp:Transcript_17342/g.41690  ORF Transcript_17342/g.41690 Transcript_17342/m.41690 type:complete len:251 (+) Transcript_17342:363-1115(+)